MTISSVYTPTVYTGNGVTLAFPTVFMFMASEDLLVSLIRVADQFTRILVLGHDYSVSGAGNLAGGTVTMVVAPTAEYELQIERRTEVTQPLDLVANDGAPAEAQERALDRLTMMIQELGQRLTDLVLSPGAALFSNGNMPPVYYPNSLFPFYSGVNAGVHTLRQLLVGSPFVTMRILSDNFVEMVDTGFFDSAYSEGGSTYTQGRGKSAMQIRHEAGWAFPHLVLWQGDGAADNAKWTLIAPTDGTFGIAPITDDLETWNESFSLSRSGATPTGMKVNVPLDMSAKRVGNVGAFDFDESAKGSVSGAQTFDFTAFNCYSLTLTGNVTATFTAPVGATTTYIEATQDGTGSRTFSFPAAVKWTAATAAGDKLLSTGASKRDLIVLKWNAAGTAALAQIFKDW